VGIEALSRGASGVVFVERDRRAAALIAENLRHCGVSDGYDIIRADIERMSRPAGSPPFDVIVLDPPYAETDLLACVTCAAPWLAAGGVLVLEHARRRTSPPRAGRLTLTRVVQSGDSALSFYRHGSADALTAGGTGAA
jgi:16S rRNA (guanine966-N2)-methyltransferase